ncbi:MAG: radical SAM protein [Defluviitaleaceae bacterium]|nr:radical SAM protein [Defluviitaleaceae bacterium]MCL2276158.1 radical SAM protein [Defluviitaleaceae bacterium]
MYNVVEMFDSLEGEGKRAGATATFIRLGGCNLRCTYCDTPQALEATAGEKMTLEQILSRVNTAFNRVTLTGGEPLLAEGADALVRELLSRGIEVNIETNGSVDIADFRQRVGDGAGLFFTIDYKLPSSGVCDKMLDGNYFALRGADVLKFVVGSESDVPAMLHLVERLQGRIINAVFTKNEAPIEMPQIFIGAVAAVQGGSAPAMDLPTLAALIVNTPILKDARMQLQFHKIIWGADAQGV